VDIVSTNKKGVTVFRNPFFITGRLIARRAEYILKVPYDGVSESIAKFVLEQLQEGGGDHRSHSRCARPRILWVNSAWERITGYTADQAVGANPAILQGPRDLERCLDFAPRYTRETN